MDRLLKNIAFWTLIILAVLFFYKFLQQPSTAPAIMDSGRFADALRAGKIARVTLPMDATIGGDLAQAGPDGKPAHFLIATPAYRDLMDDLLRQNVAIEFRSPRESSPLINILGWLPILLMLGVWVYFMRSMQAGRRKAENQPSTPS
ncbi:MAG TPA: hypothetical protein VGV60_12575 [Candidatus Polarisedimenticolia bacterium]|jgi:cell division protease FtsH|nr:hypothetical protein [Candidatus Polarisedimenticolia bacterium]